MEGPHPHLARRFANQCLDPGPHLARRLVGERDREQAVRPDAVRRDQVGDAGGEDAGLSAARPGEDQERPVTVGHGLSLGRVQAREEAVDLGLGRLGNHGSIEFTEALLKLPPPLSP